MSTTEMKGIAPFALAAIAAFMVYTKRYAWALYVGIALAAWLGYDYYEKKSVEAPAGE